MENTNSRKPRSKLGAKLTAILMALMMTVACALPTIAGPIGRNLIAAASYPIHASQHVASVVEGGRALRHGAEVLPIAPIAMIPGPVGAWVGMPETGWEIAQIGKIATLPAMIPVVHATIWNGIDLALLGTAAVATPVVLGAGALGAGALATTAVVGTGAAVLGAGALGAAALGTTAVVGTTALVGTGLVIHHIKENAEDTANTAANVANAAANTTDAVTDTVSAANDTADTVKDTADTVKDAADTTKDTADTASDMANASPLTQIVNGVKSVLPITIG